MRIPIAKIAELLHPTGRQVTPANVAVAPRFKPQDEDQQRKQREKSGEREEQNAEKSFQFQTHISFFFFVIWYEREVGDEGEDERRGLVL